MFILDPGVPMLVLVMVNVHQKGIPFGVCVMKDIQEKGVLATSLLKCVCGLTTACCTSTNLQSFVGLPQR